MEVLNYELEHFQHLRNNISGNTGAGGAEASIPLGEKGSVLDQSRYPARVDYPLQEYGSSRFMTGSRHPSPPPFASPLLGTGIGTGAVLVPHESLRNPPLPAPARRAASAAGYRSLRIYGGSVKEL